MRHFLEVQKSGWTALRLTQQCRHLTPSEGVPPRQPAACPPPLDALSSFTLNDRNRRDDHPHEYGMSSRTASCHCGQLSIEV
jgi:hypothetical protein